MIIHVKMSGYDNYQRRVKIHSNTGIIDCYNSRVSMSLSTPENGVRSGENRTQHDVMQSRCVENLGKEQTGLECGVSHFGHRAGWRRSCPYGPSPAKGTNQRASGHAGCLVACTGWSG